MKSRRTAPAPEQLLLPGIDAPPPPLRLSLIHI